MTIPRAVLALAAILALAGCRGPDFRHAMGGPPRTAATPLPDIPTVPAPNPFFCPGSPS